MRLQWDKMEALDSKLEKLTADSTLSWEKIGSMLAVGGSSARMRATRKQYPGWNTSRPGERHVAPTITTPGPPPTTTDELWERVEKVTNLDVARHQSERLIDISIPDDRPVGISFISDQHIRQSGPIMMARMREDAELIQRTDGLYAALGGDGVDNHIKHREAMANGGDKPKDSWKLYDHYLGMFSEKILAMISGNHDDWTRDFTGIDMVKNLADNNRIHYAPDEALLRLEVGGTPYRVLVRHQFHSGNSRLNLNMAVKRLWELGNDDFDIGVLGHHHEAAVEPFVKHGLRRWAFRPGSYQISSSYSRRKGFNHSYPTCPTVVLWPNRRQLVGFWDVWEAASYLNLLRENWPGSDLVRPTEN